MFCFQWCIQDPNQDRGLSRQLNFPNENTIVVLEKEWSNNGTKKYWYWTLRCCSLDVFWKGYTVFVSVGRASETKRNETNSLTQQNKNQTHSWRWRRGRWRYGMVSLWYIEITCAKQIISIDMQHGALYWPWWTCCHMTSMFFRLPRNSSSTKYPHTIYFFFVDFEKGVRCSRLLHDADLFFVAAEKRRSETKHVWPWWNLGVVVPCIVDSLRKTIIQSTNRDKQTILKAYCTEDCGYGGHT